MTLALTSILILLSKKFHGVWQIRILILIMTEVVLIGVVHVHVQIHWGNVFGNLNPIVATIHSIQQFRPRQCRVVCSIQKTTFTKVFLLILECLYV